MIKRCKICDKVAPHTQSGYIDLMCDKCALADWIKENTGNQYRGRSI